MKQLILFLLFLSGCGWFQHDSAPPPTTASPPGALLHYPLMSPASYGGSFVAQNLLEGQAQGEHFQLHVHLEIDSNRILVLGFTPWQTRAFVLRYDGQRLEFENFTHRDMPFPPVMILADIQQVLWPVLPDQAQWHAVDDIHKQERRVYFRGQLMTHIQYNGDFPSHGDVELSNLSFGYQLRIRKLES